jgi:hypothetical protein
MGSEREWLSTLDTLTWRNRGKADPGGPRPRRAILFEIDSRERMEPMTTTRVGLEHNLPAGADLKPLETVRLRNWVHAGPVSRR